MQAPATTAASRPWCARITVCWSKLQPKTLGATIPSCRAWYVAHFSLCFKTKRGPAKAEVGVSM